MQARFLGGSSDGTSTRKTLRFLATQCEGLFVLSYFEDPAGEQVLSFPAPPCVELSRAAKVPNFPLENRCTFTGTGGSNPSASAIPMGIVNLAIIQQ